MTMTSNSPLSETAKLIAQVLNGASERAVLIANDGTVLHLNSAAERFLHVESEHPHVRDFLVSLSSTDDSDDWCRVPQSHVRMKTGKTTRTPRNIQWVTSSTNGTVLYTAYICSKHERVREIVDHAFDPVLTADARGIIKTVNQAVCDLFGYAEGEMVGQNISILCGGVHAAMHDQYMQNYHATGQRKIIGKRREVEGKKKDGSEFPCELGIQEITDISTGQRFFCGFIKDLTLIKQHEAEIRQRQDLLQGMINAALDPMLEIDQEGTIHVVNNSACNMFGYKREEFLGQNVSIICGGEHSAQHAEYMKRYFTTGEKRILGRKRQVPARRRDGSEFNVELCVQEVELSNGRKAFCGFLRDMTLHDNARRTMRKQQQMIHGKFFGTDDDRKQTT